MQDIVSNGSGDSTTTRPRAGADTVGRATGVQDPEAGLRTRPIFWRVKRRFGHIPLSTRIRARDPKLLELAER